ncbi:MAG: 4Fe-4S binding protein [Lachnospiraceae bacterium]
MSRQNCSKRTGAGYGRYWTISKERCCGCAACVSACPADAISMEEGEEGFLFPKIDLERCIGCGKCLLSCPEAEKQPERKKRCPVLQRPPKMPCA